MNKLQLSLVALSVLLIASLSANILLYKKLKNTFISLYQTSLNPLGIDKYDNRDITTTELPSVVFFGDSRANQWKFPDEQNFQFINRGISGQTSAQIRWRFQQHIVPLEPQIIVLQLGVNDLRMLPDNSQTRDDLVKNCQQNITQIIEEAERINAVVILTTIFPLGAGDVSWKYRPFWASIDELQQSINEVNQYLKTLGDRVIVLDAYSLLDNKDRQKIEYYKDLLHLNRRGYELLNQELEKILLEVQMKQKV